MSKPYIIDKEGKKQISRQIKFSQEIKSGIPYNRTSFDRKASYFEKELSS
jgi:hypothetical protein